MEQRQLHNSWTPSTLIAHEHISTHIENLEGVYVHYMSAIDLGVVEKNCKCIFHYEGLVREAEKRFLGAGSSLMYCRVLNLTERHIMNHTFHIFSRPHIPALSLLLKLQCIEIESKGGCAFT